MDSHGWGEHCIICDAPLKPVEYGPHLRACVRIEAQRTGRTDAEIGADLTAVLRSQETAQATAETPVPPSRPWWDWRGEPEA